MVGPTDQEVAIKDSFVTHRSQEEGDDMPGGLGGPTQIGTRVGQEENVGRSLLQGFCWEEHVS